MKRNTTIAVLTLSVLLIGLNTARAGHFDPKRVPADALWVVHADFSAMINSTLGQLIIKDLRNLGLDEHIDRIKKELGLDPLMDFAGVTIYGTGYERADAVAIVEMGPTTGKLADKVAQAPGYELLNHNGAPIHSWIDKYHHQVRKYCGVLARANTAQDIHLLVFSESKAKVIAALDLLTQGGRNLNQSKSDALSRRPAAGSFVFVAGDVTDALLAKKPRAVMLGLAESVVIDYGEIAGKIYGRTQVQAVSADKASLMLQMVQGMLAMGRVEPPEGPTPINRLANAVQASVNGKNLSVTFSYDAKQLHQELKTLHEMKKRRCRESQSENKL